MEDHLLVILWLGIREWNCLSENFRSLISGNTAACHATAFLGQMYGDTTERGLQWFDCTECRKVTLQVLKWCDLLLQVADKVSPEWALLRSHRFYAVDHCSTTAPYSFVYLLGMESERFRILSPYRPSHHKNKDQKLTSENNSAIKLVSV